VNDSVSALPERFW